MSCIEFFDYRIVHIDGTIEHVESATREVVSDDVLSLYRKNGEYAETEHFGSWPLVNIRSWKRTRR